MTEKLQTFLGPELLPLVADGERLLASAGGGFTDYAFVVFPFAKAYEGFLKKLFFQIGAINEGQLNSDHWRVGKALNPQLEKQLRHEESVYDRVCATCGGGQELADTLWQAWKRGRNQVFHYFPGKHKGLSFEEAREIVRGIEMAMEKALEECKIGN